MKQVLLCCFCCRPPLSNPAHAYIKCDKMEKASKKKKKKKKC